MACPPKIADILLEIVKLGVLRVRAAGWSNDAKRCALEADHIHNLPDLLSNFSCDRLAYYWDAERPSFIQQSTSEDLAVFEPLWDKLRGYVVNATDPVLTR
jgi:hypothetical protein